MTNKIHLLVTVVAILLLEVAEGAPSSDSNISPDEFEPSYWRLNAKKDIDARLKLKPITTVAKNVIIFMGDGMGIPTLTATRIYLGQLANKSGEDNLLSFEKFPYTGLQKTYCVDKQVPDSACTATAYLSGVKINYDTIGVTAAVKVGDCAKAMDPKFQVDSILNWAQEAGKATGVITNDRITGPSPSGNFAHSGFRPWESDEDMISGKYKADPTTCQDIARQLVQNKPGKDITVLMGGGSSKFLPNITKTKDAEGERLDGRDLTKEWLDGKKDKGPAKVVRTREDLLAVDIDKTEYLFGLFNESGMPYHLENIKTSPSLAEMTEVSIRMLQKEKKGFYLFVENENIDNAHHENMARNALDETAELDKAVKKALELVDLEDTLILVIADHSHTMEISGFPQRGTDILGMAGKTTYGLPYMTLSYANGPSATKVKDYPNKDLTKDDYKDPMYPFPALVPLGRETHGGEDVAVYARGPWAHLLVGNYEQTVVAMVMAYAAAIGPYADRLDKEQQ